MVKIEEKTIRWMLTASDISELGHKTMNIIWYNGYFCVSSETTHPITAPMSCPIIDTVFDPSDLINCNNSSQILYGVYSLRHCGLSESLNPFRSRATTRKKRDSSLIWKYTGIFIWIFEFYSLVFLWANLRIKRHSTGNECSNSYHECWTCNVIIKAEWTAFIN